MACVNVPNNSNARNHKTVKNFAFGMSDNGINKFYTVRKYFEML